MDGRKTRRVFDLPVEDWVGKRWTTGTVDTLPDTQFPPSRKPYRKDRAACGDGRSNRMHRRCAPCSRNLQPPLGQYRFRRKSVYGGGGLRMVMAGSDKTERDQRGVIHLAAEYARVLQGCPRIPPASTRVQTVGVQLRQHEYQSALLFARQLKTPSTQRGYGMISAAHDALSPHHDRGFEDIQLFFSSLRKTNDMSLVALEVGIGHSPVAHRALDFSDVGEFKIDKSMALGVWGHHTRFLIPTSETLPSSWREWRDMFGNVAIKTWMNCEASSKIDTNPYLRNIR